METNNEDYFLDDALPPPALPLISSQYFESISTTSESMENVQQLQIPFRTWIRMQQKRLHRLNRQRATLIHPVPTTDLSIPAELLLSASKEASTIEFKRQCLRILRQLLPEWLLITSPDQLEVTRLTGAMTNSMFICSPRNISRADSPSKILLRIYGQGSDAFFNRQREIFILQVLSCMRVGPRLLGMFQNGRFEEFIDSDSLFCRDLCDPLTSRMLAEKLFEVHSLVGIIPKVSGGNDINGGSINDDLVTNTVVDEYESELWDRIEDWLIKAEKSATVIRGNSCLDLGQGTLVDFSSLRLELSQWKRSVKSVDSFIVFAHNDLQYGNILKRRNQPQTDNYLMLIDFEYAGYNYRGFDIANHFCEWAANYHSDHPERMDFSKIPTQEERNTFYGAYLNARDDFIKSKMNHRRSSFSSLSTSTTGDQLCLVSSFCPPATRLSTIGTPTHPLISPRISGSRDPEHLAANMPELSPSLSPMLTPELLKTLRNQEMAHLEREVQFFTPLSHLMWALWGIVQDQQSVIDFDYLEYSRQRFLQYQLLKTIGLSA